MIRAEDFLNNYRFKAGEHIGNSDLDTIAQYARDFARLHVNLALKAASENAEVIEGYNTGFSGSASSINHESILNAYPLENIK